MKGGQHNTDVGAKGKVKGGGYKHGENVVTGTI